MEGYARKGWSYRVMEARIKCIKIWREELINTSKKMHVGKLCQEEEHGLNENCVQYCIFSSLQLSTMLAYFGFSCYYLVLQKHRLVKITYKPMWFSHRTKIFPLFTSELICVTEKLGSRIGCMNLRGVFCLGFFSLLFFGFCFLRWLLFLTWGLW